MNLVFIFLNFILKIFESAKAAVFAENCLRCNSAKKKLYISVSMGTMLLILQYIPGFYSIRRWLRSISKQGHKVKKNETDFFRLS